MPRDALTAAQVDPTPIFELFRGSYATELLTAAVAEFNVFGRLANGPRAEQELRQEIGLAERPATVLFTALRAMELLVSDPQGNLALTTLAREHLVPGGEFDVSEYIRLAADAPNVREMIERLRTNRPAGAKPNEEGTAFIYRDGVASAMDNEASARRFTLALAGRAKNVAPFLGYRAPLGDARLLLDVGGGTGLYSIACLQRHAQLRAIVWDRPEVLKLAGELAAEYGVADRLECQAGDAFADPVPAGADVILLSNFLHDWDVPECRRLLARCADSLGSGGQIWIHDVFLNDTLDGPLPVALYSAALFACTEGRAYSAAEYRGWLEECGLSPRPVIPTLVHCGILPAVKG
jgi:hypothetical protein